MPHPRGDQLNDLEHTRTRMYASAARGGDGPGMASCCKVGTTLLAELLDVYDRVARMHQAGWRIGDDGDPYQPDGLEP